MSMKARAYTNLALRGVKPELIGVGAAVKVIFFSKTSLPIAYPNPNSKTDTES